MTNGKYRFALSAAVAVLGSGLCCLAAERATLVARPAADAWPTPSFRGKPFWPLFAKLSHGRPSPVADGKGELGALAGLTPYDADTGKSLQVKNGAFTVTVGPGDVRFVTIR